MTEPGSRSRRIYRRLTPEERARHAEIRKQVEAEKPELETEARASVDRYEASLLRYLRIQGVFDVAAAVAALKSARQQQDLSLAEVSERSGIDERTLSDLETGENPNPTLRALQGYAQAVGQRMGLGVVEAADRQAVENRPGTKAMDRREAG